MEALRELRTRIESSLAEMDQEMGDAERSAYSARSIAEAAGVELAAATEKVEMRQELAQALGERDETDEVRQRLGALLSAEPGREADKAAKEAVAEAAKEAAAEAAKEAAKEAPAKKGRPLPPSALLASPSAGSSAARVSGALALRGLATRAAALEAAAQVWDELGG